MPVSNVGSRWSGGDLIFYEKNVSLAVIGNILEIADDEVVVGSTTNDINFVWKGTTTGTFTLDAGTHTLALTGLAASSDGAIASSSASGGIGYATGAGGTVTQGTSKSTGVTLSKITGEIIMHAEALAAGAEVGFTVTNTTVAATDVVVANLASVATAASYTLTVDAVSAGSFKLSLGNVSAGSLSEAVKINFAVIKAVKA